MAIHDPTDVAAAVSRNVRDLRLERRYTLDALATRADISKGMLVQVEQGRTNPSLATLVRLANALGVSVPRLVDLGGVAPVRVVTEPESVVLWTGDKGGEGRLIAGSGEPDLLELWDWRMTPGETYSAEPQPVGAVEIVHVLSGQLTLDVEHESYEVASGECVIFRADRAHGYSNQGVETLRMIISFAVASTKAGSREARR